jgi:HAD superfamily hydrolase (TIGR01509 family)
MINIKNKIDFSNFECAIFDLDGTLVNSTLIWSRVDKEFFERRKLTMPKECPHEIKTHTLYSGAQYLIGELGLSDTPEQIVDEWQSAAKRMYDNDVTLKAGVKEFLHLLKYTYNYKIGLATSNDRAVFTQCLKNNGIYDYFDSITQADEVARRKGYPDIYELSASRMNAARDKCIVFEDVLAAVKGAKMGNFFTAAVEDEASAADREAIKAAADIYIKNYYELM